MTKILGVKFGIFSYQSVYGFVIGAQMNVSFSGKWQ